MSATVEAKAVYQEAFSRWKSALTSETTRLELCVTGRLIVGLGADNILETGITLHHTYGVPFIPGSGLKGLAAHYCDHVWGAPDPEFRKEIPFEQDGPKKTRAGAHFLELFGSNEDAGHLIFHDAWITPDSLGKGSGLVLDVMTPHHADYYSEKKSSDGGLIPPTDFDDPTPITFLSVTGRFLVAVSCDVSSDDGKKWSTLGMTLLTEALREWGVGGKTSSGYGRLVLPGEVSSAPAPETVAHAPKGLPAPRSKPQAGPQDRQQSKATGPSRQVAAANSKPRKPPPVKPTTRLETVTLLDSPSSTGKARVRTGAGDELLCSNFPAYPKLQAGDQVRAEVTRGVPQPRAAFKRMP
jgi:CRISPR type III-B/RAMP module RAMP protein Cmr6